MKKNESKRNLIVLLLLVCFSVLSTDLLGQCPMCKMAAETNLKNGGTAAQGLNMGIIYLLVFPYILMGTVGYLWWKNRRDVLEQEQEEELLSLLEEYDMTFSDFPRNEESLM